MFKIISTKLSDFKVSSEKERHYYVTCPAFWGHHSGPKQTITGRFDKKYVYGIHKEKHRKVAKQTGKNSHKIVSKAYWISTVYKFPIERVKSFRQYARHFDVELY